MRRSDRECSNPEFVNEVLNSAPEMHVAFSGGDMPYVVPLNFVYADGVVYFHCAPEGRKLELLARDNRVAFSACTDVEVDSARQTTYFKSVCGNGTMRVVTDEAEMVQALALLGKRYEAPCPPSTPEVLERLRVLRMDVAVATGKHLRR